MTASGVPLLRLLQLASPALPVGAYSYSQGLEAAVNDGAVADASTAECWIGDVLVCGLAYLDGPLLLRLCAAWARRDAAAVAHWNGLVLASRESAELCAETAQMGFSLRQLLLQLVPAAELGVMEEISYPTAFAYAATAWDIAPADALSAYLWSWLENQVMAALKAVPLGQTAGQRMLLALSERARAAIAIAQSVEDDDIGAVMPRLALLSAAHESQYSRIFRS